MKPKVTGLHHVTALASDGQRNLDFYAGILGLRLVKKTVNFDAPDVYHVYYGDETGNPGTLLTFFPYPGLVRGRKGKGQLTVTSFSIHENSLDYWIKRLARFKITHTASDERFGEETFIYFEDFDGLGLELVAINNETRPGIKSGTVPHEHSIRGFHSVTLSQEGYERTAGLLTGQMDHKPFKEAGNRFRFSTDGAPGTIVDILCSPDTARGLGGSGTVHHVAFATPSDETQLQQREQLMNAGLDITPVLDRQYFHSIYYREPGGVLFEVATNPPGFATDEAVEHLGTSLKLPPWMESNRAKIEAQLPPIGLDLKKYQD